MTIERAVKMAEQLSGKPQYTQLEHALRCLAGAVHLYRQLDRKQKQEIANLKSALAVSPAETTHIIH